MITNSRIFRSFRDCKLSTFDSQVASPNPEFRSNSSMFRIVYISNKVGVFRFELFIYMIFLNVLKYSFTFDMKVEGSFNFIDVLSISKSIQLKH